MARLFSTLRPGIAAWITGVSLLALMPMMAFSAYVVYRQTVEQQRLALTALQRRVQVAAAAIGQELDSILAELTAVSQADAMQLDDPASIRALLQRVVAVDPRIDDIRVDAGPADAASVSTFLPASGPLPPGVVLSVALPPAAGAPRRLVARVRLDAIGARLNEQAWPEDWTVALLDSGMVILARSRAAAQFIGQGANQALRDKLRLGEPVFESVTLEGDEVVVSTAPVARGGWLVVAGRPRAGINAQVRNSMLSIAGAGLLCALVAIGGALLLARLMGRQLHDVVQAHAAGSAGGAPPFSAIHEVAQLSAALTRAQQTAERASGELVGAREEVVAHLSERSEMLDVLAHEVRQPLNNASAALQAAAVVLQRDGERLAAAPLQRAGAVLSEVQASIDNTLAVAALLVGHGLAREDSDIDALVAVAIADLPPADAGRVRVERATRTRTAAMDASLMRLALRNLLSNALKYSPRTAPVVVRVADSDEPLALLIDVIDAGPGIPTERLARLFERADRRPPSPGARRQGLGLYIVRRVMELHGGSVQLVRNGADGATMRLVIDQAGDDE